MSTLEQKQKKAEYMKAYYYTRKTDPKYMEDRRIARAKNKEKSREYNREWNQRYIAEWRAKNYAKDKQSKAEVRARKIGVQIEPTDYQAILDMWNHICGICTEKVIGAFHFDHTVPLSMGGPHARNNIQITHPSCNFKKGNRV